jgi:hypothetical protein
LNAPVLRLRAQQTCRVTGEPDRITAPSSSLARVIQQRDL